MFFRKVCPLCLRPGLAPCDDCWVALDPAPISSVEALLAFSGEGARLLKALKYSNGRAVVGRVADGMSLLVQPGWADVVTWAPTSARRRSERGYDQAEVLAKAVARRLGVPCRSLLRRLPDSGPQTGRTRSERLVGPGFAGKRQAPPRVLLIDDVVTTGSTLRSAAGVLRMMGAREVRLLAAASTPDHVPTKPERSPRPGAAMAHHGTARADSAWPG
jgi:predicted amidophosphoribosyltransferase